VAPVVASAVAALPFPVGAARPVAPYRVVARVVVDGYVVVHARVGGGGGREAVEGPRVKDGEQRCGGGRRSLGAGQQFPRRDGPAVQLRVGVFPLHDRGPLERDAGEQPLGLGVAEDAGHAPERRRPGRLGVAADGPGGDGHVPAQCEGAGLAEGLDGAGVVEDEDEVGQLEAYLAAEAGAARGDGGGRAPAAVGEARDDEARAEARGAEEASLDDGQDGEALGVSEDRRRYDFLGTEGLARVDEGGEDLAALFTFRWRSEKRG
jgi:hypothetical protein